MLSVGTCGQFGGAQARGLSPLHLFTDVLLAIPTSSHYHSRFTEGETEAESVTHLLSSQLETGVWRHSQSWGVDLDGLPEGGDGGGAQGLG